jgi:hypothetical protein
VTAQPHPALRCAAWLASVALGGTAGEAAAHGFGQRYDLPLPLLLFIVTGGVMVAASFALTGGKHLSLGWPLPQWLGVWPAVVLLLAFSWAEIVWSGNEVPANIAAVLLGYAILTFAGMHVFGREPWLARGEVFSLVFGLFARFSPTEVRVRSSVCCNACDQSACRLQPGDCVQCQACLARAEPGQWEWNLRPFGAGLLCRAPVVSSMAVLVCVALATVTFDGVRETPFWERIKFWAFHPLQPTAGPKAELLLTAGLVFTAGVFLAAYTGCCTLVSALVTARMQRAGNPGAAAPRAWTLARLFRDWRLALLSQYPLAVLRVAYTMLSLWILAQPVVEQVPLG